MRLIRLRARQTNWGIRLVGDYKSSEGKRVSYPLGLATNPEQMKTLVDLVLAAGGDAKELRKIGRT